jgi:protein-S-isoprenylcysteine O-methyltransferase Ste14
MSDRAAHQNQWETADVVFGIPTLISIILSFLWPLSITDGLLRLVLRILGIILFVAGAGLIIAARRELTRHGQPAEPRKPTTGLVTSGVFSFTRNPLYLGVIVMICGAGLILNSWWIFIGLVPAIILCHTVLIIPEERYLSSLFGEEFIAYTHSVRTWFGRK